MVRFPPGQQHFSSLTYTSVRLKSRSPWSITKNRPFSRPPFVSTANDLSHWAPTTNVYMNERMITSKKSVLLLIEVVSLVSRLSNQLDVAQIAYLPKQNFSQTIKIDHPIHLWIFWECIVGCFLILSDSFLPLNHSVLLVHGEAILPAALFNESFHPECTNRKKSLSLRAGKWEFKVVLR